MWSNRNGQPLLAGIRNGTATLRESLAVSYITNHTLTIGSSSYLLLEFTQRNWKLVVQSLSCAWLFVTLWTAARQVSPSFAISQSLLRFTSIESVMPFNHLILCHSPSPLMFSQIWMWIKPGLLHCGQILYPLSHQESPWMFITALFITAKIWKQLRYPSIGKWVNKLRYI